MLVNREIVEVAHLLTGILKRGYRAPLAFPIPRLCRGRRVFPSERNTLKLIRPVTCIDRCEGRRTSSLYSAAVPMPIFDDDAGDEPG